MKAPAADPGAPAPRQPSPAPDSPTASFWVALTGNPNCGKTTLFNALTGMRAKVGNYAGVTVERKEGRLLGAGGETPVTVLDLPGTYSLSPQSLDEQISRDILFRRLPEVPAPDLVVVVVDASNLERNLYYATQVIELGCPTLIALNMVDVAEQNGHQVDAALLAAELGVPVCPMVASAGQGVEELRQAILKAAAQPRPASGTPTSFGVLPASVEAELGALAQQLGEAFPERARHARPEALLLLTDDRHFQNNLAHYNPALEQAVLAARARLEAAGVDWRTVAIETRYARLAEIQQAVVTEEVLIQETLSDRLDRVLTHRFWGVAIFLVVMTLMFQSIFVLAKLPMQALEQGVGWLGGLVGALIPPGDLHSLAVDGAIAGVGAVVVFLPQICLLFLFIGLLEDTGYMARAAFLMDRLMSKVGLHGKSFIPMLSSFACAIPGIMATRTIESPKDRLVTILVAPLMSCSARMPVYTLLIAACVPDVPVLAWFHLPGLTLLGMYLLGVLLALAMASLFKKTLLKGATPMLILELPPYKRPMLRVVLRHMWDRSRLFLRRAGTVILGINILLWFLVTYPRDAATTQRFAAQRQTLQAAAPSDQQKAQLAALDHEEGGERLRHSFAGRLGRILEPAIAPLGFDWKIGIGIVASFAAREVFVSTMSVVYNVGDQEDDPTTLAATLREQRRPDGLAVYTPLTGFTLMIFYVAALQCVSTVAVVRRETNSWKWPVFQWAYMGVLAWVLSFVVYQGGRLLGWQ